MKFRLPGKKIDKKKYVSVILIFLTIGSTAAYSVIQALGWGSNRQQTAQVELPNVNVVDYEFTNDQKDYMIRYGKTILEYRYQMGCANCSVQKAYLESAVNQFSDQLFLQEIVDNSQTKPALDVMSYYGSRNLKDPSNTAILNALCEIMVEPPILCATRNV
jgi:hypothetical protein